MGFTENLLVERITDLLAFTYELAIFDEIDRILTGDSEAYMGFNAFNTKRITGQDTVDFIKYRQLVGCLLYTSPSPRDS